MFINMTYYLIPDFFISRECGEGMSIKFLYPSVGDVITDLKRRAGSIVTTSEAQSPLSLTSVS